MRELVRNAAGDSGSDFEARILTSEGNIRWVRATARPPETSASPAAELVGIIRDVTAARSEQEATKKFQRQLETLIANLPGLAYRCSLAAPYRIAIISDGAESLTGISASQWMTGDLAWLDIVHPDDAASVAREVDTAISAKRGFFISYRIIRHDGAIRWVQERGQAIYEEGKPICLEGFIWDVTEQVQSQLDLANSELLNRSVMEASADCIKILGLDGTLQVMNSPGLCAMELDSFQQVEGMDWVSLWPVRSHREVRAALKAAARGETARFTAECPTARGTIKWWDVVVTPMLDASGQVSRVLSISRDITVSRATSEQLRNASEQDALTELPNRRTFQAHLQAATIRAMESGGMVGLLLIDLDHFKHVNDTLGHQAGDHLLKTFARRMRSSVRAGDFVARLGGDEFAIVLEAAAEDDLLKAGEAILKRLREPVRTEGRALSAGASIGGALFPRDAANAQELFKNADTALYALKSAGRGGVKMFHNYMREEAQKVALQLSLARMAITERTVVPHYQPKINLKSGLIVGFEALLRWYHPQRGLREPDQISEAFKDYELASKIGELMQNKVFSDIAHWRRNGVEVGLVSLNAAPVEFLRDDYAERLLARMREHGVPGDVVEIEVTEHAFLDRGAEYVARSLNLLKKAGIKIALDDFGTGYSSLSHLRDFPVDVVKIDRSFVAQMVGDNEIAAIVRAVIDLARSLSIEVVAEGVETIDQLRLLKAGGCTMRQGWYFGRAVAADEIMFSKAA